MIGSIVNTIVKVIAWVKTIQIKQVVVVALAGFFLLTSTACGANSSAADSRAAEDHSASSPYGKDNTPRSELYKPTQRRVGGMNEYNDDPKYDRDSVQAETQRYVNRIENRQERKQANNPKDVFENIREGNPFAEKARESAQNIQESTGSLARDLSEGTQEGSQNLKQNLGRAAENTPRIVDEARQTAQDAAADFGEGANSLFGGFQNAAERAASNAVGRDR